MNVTYIFGDYTLEVGKRELSRNGVIVEMTRRDFDVLLLLIERRDKALDKETIIRLVWGETHVGDASLTTLIARLRKALRDSEDGSRYILTLPRYGYRFCAEVQRLETPAAAQAEAPVRARRFVLVTDDQRYPLTQGEFTLGRDPSSVLIFFSNEVSRRHARVTLRGDKLQIVDLDSDNGTYVNDKRITAPTSLRHGDKVRLAKAQAKAQLWVRDMARNAATDTVRTKTDA